MYMYTYTFINYSITTVNITTVSDNCLVSISVLIYPVVHVFLVFVVIRYFPGSRYMFSYFL